MNWNELCADYSSCVHLILNVLINYCYIFFLEDNLSENVFTLTRKFAYFMSGF